MSHEIETAIYSTREGAGWTGLGRSIPLQIARDPDAMAAMLGATYTVAKRSAYYQGADGQYHEIPDASALIRTDTGAAFCVATDSRYHIDNRQPRDILAAFRDELASERLEISHAAVLAGGSRIAVCALLPSESDIKVGGVDTVT